MSITKYNINGELEKLAKAINELEVGNGLALIPNHLHELEFFVFWSEEALKEREKGSSVENMNLTIKKIRQKKETDNEDWYCIIGKKGDSKIDWYLKLKEKWYVPKDSGRILRADLLVPRDSIAEISYGLVRL